MESRIALGTAQFGMDYGINNPRGKIPKKDVFRILEYAAENGITCLDTAFGYGESENLIGEFIRDKKVAFDVVTKLPEVQKNDVGRVFRESLDRLSLERLYGVLVHSFESYKKDPGILEALTELKECGDVEKIGFSLYYPQEGEYLLKNCVGADMVQVPFNIFDQRFSQIFPELKAAGTEIHVRSVFLQGLVFKNPRDLKGVFLKVKDKITDLKLLSDRIGVSLEAICINFPLLNATVDKVVLGVDSIDNLKDNIQSLDFQEKVRDIYSNLGGLREDNEDIILPINWGGT
jgi:aryl-alcohol dehydrogenase-like predicted oxidoreductase